MKEELEQFNIDMDTIRPTNEFFENLQEAIEEMRKNTLKDRFEVILNNNLINCVEIKNNFRTILGCRVSFENLDRNISFIVKEDLKPSYEKLEQEIDHLHSIIKEVREYIEKCSILGVNEVDSYCMDYDVRDDLLKILDKESEVN